MRKKKKGRKFLYKEAINDHRMVGPWLRKQIFTRDKWICQLCGDPVTAQDATIDHRVPLSRGGDNSPGNLQTAHETCNKTKGDLKL